MRYLKTSEAATLLNVTPATLRMWESRFAFPTPQRSAGNHRMYLYGEVIALRDTLRVCGSTTSAVRAARETLASRDASLIAALGGYDRRRADVAMEVALGSRSLQRCVEEVLLPALEQIARQRTFESAAWAFAARWGADWLRRATRFVAPRSCSVSIVLGDASRDELDRDAPHIRALELFSIRAGVQVMSLSVRGVAGLVDAIQARRPDLIVIAGGQLADETVRAWAQSARAAAGPIPIALYRRADQLTRIPNTAHALLPNRASDAHHRMIELVQNAPAAATAPLFPAIHDSNVAVFQHRPDHHSRRHDGDRQTASGLSA